MITNERRATQPERILGATRRDGATFRSMRSAPPFSSGGAVNSRTITPEFLTVQLRDAG
jgi:hypothetical protein